MGGSWRGDLIKHVHVIMQKYATAFDALQEPAWLKRKVIEAYFYNQQDDTRLLPQLIWLTLPAI